jgi:6-phosphogluconate dehydrogenase
LEKGDIIIDGGNSASLSLFTFALLRELLYMQAQEADADFLLPTFLHYHTRAQPGHYPDSNRRMDELEKKGLLFVGSGVSGGEEGARYGPSLSASHRLHNSGNARLLC